MLLLPFRAHSRGSIPKARAPRQEAMQKPGDCPPIQVRPPPPPRGECIRIPIPPAIRGPKNMLDSLPDAFSLPQLEALRLNAGKSKEGTKFQLKTWKARGFITLSPQTGLYTKTPAYLGGKIVILPDSQSIVKC